MNLLPYSATDKKIYVVTFEHPSYVNGVWGTYRTAAKARKAVKRGYRVQGFKGLFIRQRNETKNNVNPISSFIGLGAALNLNFYVYKRRVQG